MSAKVALRVKLWPGFCKGLIALEIVNRGADELASLFVWTDGVDGVADHLQGLKGDHDFIVLDVVANDHEQLRVCHGLSLSRRAGPGGLRGRFDEGKIRQRLEAATACNPQADSLICGYTGKEDDPAYEKF